MAATTGNAKLPTWGIGHLVNLSARSEGALGLRVLAAEMSDQLRVLPHTVTAGDTMV